MSVTTYTTAAGDTLDVICWRYYGEQSGAVEAVLEANPGLAALGLVYGAGEVITLPALDTTGDDEVVTLWT